MKAISDVRNSDNAATVTQLGRAIFLCLSVSSVPVPEGGGSGADTYSSSQESNASARFFLLANYGEHIEFISCLKQEICRTPTRKIEVTIHCWRQRHTLDDLNLTGSLATIRRTFRIRLCTVKLMVKQRHKINNLPCARWNGTCNIVSSFRFLNTYESAKDLRSRTKTASKVMMMCRRLSFEQSEKKSH